MRAVGRMLGSAETLKQPGELCRVECRVDLDSRVARNGGRNAPGPGAGVLGLVFEVRGREQVLQCQLQLFPFKACRGRFDGKRPRSERLGFEAVAIQLFRKIGKPDHLRRQKIDENRHQQTLPLQRLRAALPKDLLKENSLVRDVLIDDPQTFVVGGKDEGVADLPQRFQRGEGVQGVGDVGRAGRSCRGLKSLVLSLARLISDRKGSRLSELQPAGSG